MAVEHQCADWRTIQSFPDYEVSCCGVVRRRVASLRMFNRHPAGSVVPQCVSMKPYTRSDGSTRPKNYFSVTLSRYEAGKRRAYRRLVSRLVCEAFHGAPPSPEHQTAHNNGDEADNNYRNLRWATPVENQKDIGLHGRKQLGSGNHAARLTEEAVLQIIAHLMAGSTDVEVARKFGVGSVTVFDIRRLRTWRHVPRPPGFDAIFSKAAPQLFDRLTRFR